MLTRYDTAPIDKVAQDAQTGFIHITDVPIARVGVFPYLKADSSVEMEAKLPDELLSDSTVSSADSKPVTNDHPSELVNQQNASKYMKGFTADNAHVDNDTLKVDMTITDADLISEINKGKQELSIGFETEIVPEKGEYKGVAYDSVQRNIQINHVAVVKHGRAGHSVRLIGDSAEMVEQNNVHKKGQSMETTKVRLNDADVTVATGDADKIIKLDADNSEKQRQIDDLKAKIKEMQDQLAKLQGDDDKNKKNADKAQAKADAAEKELADLKEKYSGDAMDKAVTARLELINKVKPYVGDSYDFAGKSEKQLKLDAIKALDDSVDLTNKSDDYIDAYFDSMCKTSILAHINGYNGPQPNINNDSSDIEKLRFDRYHLADKK
ncbi:MULTISPECIES: DUF2213 domain-containing protein [unclassified Lactobacillus]|uniref:DUF2213 domain-containing protein n=1 Tax=unclassified Lactobacillus TaxID=2620435 RepID=UPI000EFCB8F2|nr:MULTISPECIES: DUF2213 domain-containing protein [unclassified Lactobacillus]RMC24433.1 DUF2213 domain-containing protein [Lactobacillus sp. ESL0247]RMC28572.1 DUF2213 domain-containing protein [Lactobacillus sp. ESL0246]RMC31763.1 DUF2213 domain-containing protein [Lactobacillus sp. ESL0245]